MTVADELRRHGTTEDAGGPAYLVELFQAAPCLGNSAHHAAIVAGLARKRRLIYTLHEQLDEITHDQSLTADEAQERAESAIFTLTEIGRSGQTTSMPAAVDDALAYQDRRAMMQLAGQSDAVATGFRDLDAVACGLQRAELTVVAARTGVGKSAFAIQIAGNAASAGIPVFFVALEMLSRELIFRSWSRLEKIDSWKLRKGVFPGDDKARVLDAAERVRSWPIEWDHTPNQTLTRIAANARRLKRQDKLRLLVIDYLQLIEPEDRKAPRHEQVSVITRRLKLLSRELDSAVLVAAQLNRQAEQRDRPRLSDLRDSGSIEQDADCVLLLNRTDEDDRQRGETDLIEVIIGKQRNGPCETIKLVYRKRFCEFEDYDQLPQPPFSADAAQRFR